MIGAFDMDNNYLVSREDMEGIAILSLSITALLETTPDFGLVLELIAESLTEEQIENAIDTLTIKEIK